VGSVFVWIYFFRAYTTASRVILEHAHATRLWMSGRRGSCFTSFTVGQAHTHHLDRDFASTEKGSASWMARSS
jgi:hypothetical protein